MRSAISQHALHRQLTSSRRGPDSAMSRITRLLSCPGRRLSRHLFRFFSLFFFSSEKSMFSLFRFPGRSTHVFRPAVAWLVCRFHLKNKLRGHIVVQLDRDLVLARIFDRALQNDFVSINLGAELVFEPVYDALGGD